MRWVLEAADELGEARAAGREVSTACGGFVDAVESGRGLVVPFVVSFLDAEVVRMGIKE